MSDKLPVTAINDTPNQIKSISCDCGCLWSLAQQFSYIRLSDPDGQNEYKLVRLYSARAKRIAATYARFYLETESNGTVSKKGRYYWMALGAFASKTVACLLDGWQLNMSYAIVTKKMANALAKGNLWLFSDLAPPHWFNNHYPTHMVDGMKCHPARTSEALEPHVKSILNQLPWAGESLSKINNFKPSKDILTGFMWALKFETAVDEASKRRCQWENLMAIANHEQGSVLQPLIYEDPDFVFWLQNERSWWLHWATPGYRLVFSHECSTDDAALQSEAPSDMKIEDFTSRMSWITSAAGKFHTLMAEKSGYMESELQTIAGWVKSPDAYFVY